MTAAKASCSVIIPAHNEAGVIARCLEALAPTGAAGEAQVIVVCNGCTDDTAARARGAAPWATVLETTRASKAEALNLGDTAARHFPRVYVDADVVLPARSLRLLVAQLVEGKWLAAAPRTRLNLDESGWAVRAFYRVDTKLPWAREGIGGSGVYALSAEGRRRFGSFPPITADDGFVRLHFRPSERMLVEAAESVVTPPRRVWELVAIKGRSHFGKYELASKYPHLAANRSFSNGPALVHLARSAGNWPALAVYGLVKILARRRGWRRFTGGRHAVWERDESSRYPVAGR